MKIDIATIDKLASLCKLSYDENDKIQIKNDLEKIIGFMEKLNELDTQHVAPLISIIEERNVLRSDIAEITMSKDEAMKNVPIKDSDFIKVPKVVKK